MWRRGAVKVVSSKNKRKIYGRMNMLHYVLYHTFNKRHLLTEFKTEGLPKRVLDIGCGTGIWIHDVAEHWAQMGHVEVEFHGIDLVPIQTPMVIFTFTSTLRLLRCHIFLGACPVCVLMSGRLTLMLNGII